MLEKRQRGFTLVELMATIAIGGILMAMGANAYASMRENTRVESAKEHIVSVFQQARLRAISQRVEQKVSFDHSDNTMIDASGQTHVFEGVDIQKFVCTGCVPSDPNADDIPFRSRGTASNKNIKVSSLGSDKEFIVMVHSVTGRVDVRTSCSSNVCR